MTKNTLKIYFIVVIVFYLIFAFVLISNYININSQIPEVSANLEAKQQLIIDDFNNAYKLEDCTIIMDENEIIVNINDFSNKNGFYLISRFDKNLNFKNSEFMLPPAAEGSTVIILCVFLAIILGAFLAFATWIYYQFKKRNTNPTT